MKYALGEKLPIAVFFSVLALSGCTSPQIKVHVMSAADDVKDFPSFLATGSWVTLGKLNSEGSGVLEAEEAVKDIAGLKASGAKAIVTKAAVGNLFAVEAKDTIFNSTKLSYTYFDNSKQLKSVGVAFEDNTTKVVQAIGGVLVAALGVVPFEAGNKPSDELKFPVVLDLTSRDLWAGKPVSVPGTSAWHYTLNVPGLDVRELGTHKICELVGGETEAGKCHFAKAGAASKWLKGFPVSNCINVNLEVTKGNGSAGKVVYPLTVADPDYVSLAPLPEKGTVTMHSICGADVAIDSSSTAATRALTTIQTIFDQAKAFKAAKEK